jgi:hypothetical protein
MKKFFTLLALAVLGVTSSVWAETYKITFNGKDEGNTTYFSNSGNHNFNNKFNGCTYDGVSYKNGLKMEGSTTVSWTSTAEATVTIVQSTWETKGAIQTIKLDGSVLDQSGADNSTTGCLIYTITKVASGSHSLTRGSGESGVFAIHVTYTGAVKTQLSAPEITFNATTGEVTIGSVANATKVTYTTDGTTPTAESTEYAAPFDAADGTVVKAIAIGDDVSYINSNVASETVILTGITIAAPVVKQSYGTVAISCASRNATIEYSIDGGANWNTYSRAFTLTTNTELKARASRTGCTTSAIIDETITAVPANAKTKTIVMGFGAFEGSGKVLTGRSDDVANGYTLTLLTEEDKAWGGRNKITISSISAERTTFCGSNGVQCRLDLPEGVKATKLTLYSYVNGAKSATNSAWKEVNGENLNSVINDVPMGAFNDVADYQANPDVRVFPLNNVEGSITFTNGGIQTCFVMELDIIEPSISVSVSEAGYATLYSSVALTIPEGVTAYTGVVDENKLKLTAVETTIPALTAVVLEAEEDSYTFATTTSEDFEGENDLKGVLVNTTVEANSVLVLGYENSEVGFYTFSGTTLAAGKAYLEMPDSGAPAIYFSFEDETEVTGVYNLRIEEKANAAFDLTGRRANGKGLMIQNGKVVLVK